MKRVIREMSKFPNAEARIILEAYKENELESTTFPHKGKLVDGVIYRKEDALYLIPVLSVHSTELELPEELDAKAKLELEGPEQTMEA